MDGQEHVLIYVAKLLQIQNKIIALLAENSRSSAFWQKFPSIFIRPQNCGQNLQLFFAVAVEF